MNKKTKSNLMYGLGALVVLAIGAAVAWWRSDNGSKGN